jgi:hypothetical protein
MRWFNFSLESFDGSWGVNYCSVVGDGDVIQFRVESPLRA